MKNLKKAKFISADYSNEYFKSKVQLMILRSKISLGENISRHSIKLCKKSVVLSLKE